MKYFLAAVVMMTLSMLSFAGTVVLNPGSGSQYLLVSCGGQVVNEYAYDFNSAGNAEAIVVVTTRCSLSGRGAKYRTYMACAQLEFSDAGAILTSTKLLSTSWLQGAPAVSCPASYDPVASYDRTSDGSDLGTIFFTASGSYRASLVIP